MLSINSMEEYNIVFLTNGVEKAGYSHAKKKINKIGSCLTIYTLTQNGSETWNSAPGTCIILLTRLASVTPINSIIMKM